MFLKKHAKLLAFIILVLLVLAGGLFYLRNKTNKSQKVTVVNGVTNTQPSNPDRIRFIATGDFIAHDSVNANAKQSDGSYNYLPMMSDFSPIFSAADIRFCNDPILNGGAKYGISGYPKFNSPTDFVTDMGKLGCNLVNTASNHSFDKGQGAIDASVDTWRAVPNMLAVAGQNKNQQQHDAVHYFTVGDVKFAFLAYTTYSNNDAQPTNNYGVTVFSKSLASQQIKQGKQAGAKTIIVSMRWGTEFSTKVNDEQRQIAQFLADQGVTVVLGHGSHELQPVQKLSGKNGGTTLVWYSLGNFINTQEPPETLFNGVAVMDLDPKTGQVNQVSYLPIYMHYEWSAAQASSEDLLARHNLHLYLFDDATQSMLDSQQLHTTLSDQKNRITNTLNRYFSVPLVTKSQYLQ